VQQACDATGTWQDVSACDGGACDAGVACASDAGAGD
jgi:hypothetical protein